MITTTAVASAVLTLLTQLLPGSPVAHRTVEMDGTNYHLTLAAPTRIVPERPVTVLGHGYNPQQGIFVALCAIPASVSPDDPATFTSLPTPCLGPRGAGGASHRIVNGPTGEHTSPYGPGGSFDVTLNLQPKIADGVECDVDVRCAVVTRADFTATQDRRLDLYVPVTFEKK